MCISCVFRFLFRLKWISREYVEEVVALAGMADSHVIWAFVFLSTQKKIPIAIAIKLSVCVCVYGDIELHRPKFIIWLKWKIDG